MTIAASTSPSLQQGFVAEPARVGRPLLALQKLSKLNTHSKYKADKSTQAALACAF